MHGGGSRNSMSLATPCLCCPVAYKPFRVCLCFSRYFLYTKTSLGYRYHQWRVARRKGTLHSITQPLSLSGVTITPIAIAEDNYAYLVVDTVSNMAVVIDPSDPLSVKVNTT